MAAEPAPHTLLKKKTLRTGNPVHSAFAVTIKRAYFFIFVKRVGEKIFKKISLLNQSYFDKIQNFVILT
jgi:hypothetical protein